MVHALVGARVWIGIRLKNSQLNLLDIVSLLVLAVGRSRLLSSLEFRAVKVDFDHKVLRFGGYLRNDGIAQDFASLID